VWVDPENAMTRLLPLASDDDRDFITDAPTPDDPTTRAAYYYIVPRQYHPRARVDHYSTRAVELRKFAEGEGDCIP
jgi:hypothetical protein